MGRLINCKTKMEPWLKIWPRQRKNATGFIRSYSPFCKPHSSLLYWQKCLQVTSTFLINLEPKTFVILILCFFLLFIFDPRGWPTVTACNDHYFHTYRSFVHLHFSKSLKAEQIMIVTGEIVGLSEWIIDDTSLV